MTARHCADCGRLLGMLPSGRALPFTLEGDVARCANRPACKRAGWGPSADKVSHPTIATRKDRS